MGNNCFGLKAKKKSLVQTIKAFKFPSCITIQETKLRKMGSIKLAEYQIFEKIRPGLGGGLLSAIKSNLNPVLISPVNENVEILVVQCMVNDLQIRVINGYGPQDDEPLASRLEFWNTLEQEIIAAKHSNCLVLVQLDANAKVGKSVIPSDPKETSENGKLLIELIERENLYLQNISQFCKGVITRQRKTKNGVERSAIDYILTCEQLNRYFEEMLIDEDQTFTLTKYSSMKGKKKIVKSDHNIMFAKFNIKYENVKIQKDRLEMFNLKNVECQSIFSEVTENNSQLQKCFNGGENFPNECNKFFKSFDDILHRCFRKIRVTNIKDKSDVQELLDQKLKLQLDLDSNPCNIAKTMLKTQIMEKEEKISELCAKRNCDIVKDYTQGLGTIDGNFSQLGMWKLKNNFFPRDHDPPMAKLDKAGNLITTPSSLKDLYLETYIERLHHRPIREGLNDNYQMKEIKV